MIATQQACRSLERDQCIYTSCYCEENVYKLLQSLLSDGIPAECLFAVFISNSNETIPLWEQRSSKRDDGLVVWDYHVVALEVQQQTPCVLVWDLDASLSFPCSLQRYVEHVLKADQFVLAPNYERWYRVVAAESFLKHFASDRSHMKAPDGSWLQPPPPYPCIVAANGCPTNLRRYRDMQSDICQLCQQQVDLANSSMPSDDLGTTSGFRHAVMHQATAPGIDNWVDRSTGGVDTGLQESVLAWSNVLKATQTEYGVVLSETQLINSLLGDQSWANTMI